MKQPQNRGKDAKKKHGGKRNHPLLYSEWTDTLCRYVKEQYAAGRQDFSFVELSEVLTGDEIAVNDDDFAVLIYHMNDRGVIEDRGFFAYYGFLIVRPSWFCKEQNGWRLTRKPMTPLERVESQRKRSLRHYHKNRDAINARRREKSKQVAIAKPVHEHPWRAEARKECDEWRAKRNLQNATPLR